MEGPVEVPRGGLGLPQRKLWTVGNTLRKFYYNISYILSLRDHVPTHLEPDELLAGRGEEPVPGVLRGVAGHTQTRSQHSWSRAGREVECWSWPGTEGSQRLEVGEMLLPRNLARLLHHQEAGGLEGEDLRLLQRGR